MTSPPICDECSICLSEIIPGSYRITNCGHYFHKNCLARWNNMGNNSCPNCRYIDPTIVPTIVRTIDQRIVLPNNRNNIRYNNNNINNINNIDRLVNIINNNINNTNFNNNNIITNTN